ncbi:MAG: zinc ribbon domain-containing protein [Candidatus Aminicenantales bacterium]
METEFENLIQLQKIDLEIKNTSAFLEAIPAEIEDLDKKIEESLQIVSDAREKLAENQKKRRELESETQDLKEKITKYKRQLNEVKTNIEYSSLLKEIEAAQQKADALEEEIIREMLAADEIEKEIQTASAQAEKVQKELELKKQDILQKKKAAEEKRKTLEKKRADLVPTIPSDQIRLYRSIALKKGGIVLSPVWDEFCSMCHMRVRPQMLNELKAETQIILCENCGRILYWQKKRPEKD